jgi:hypothetical protein
MPSRYGNYDRRDWPFWRRVPPWWASAVLILGTAARLVTRLGPGWAHVVDLVLIVGAVVAIVVDVRRIKAHRAEMNDDEPAVGAS